LGEATGRNPTAAIAAELHFQVMMAFQSRGLENGDICDDYKQHNLINIDAQH
jgi:hypothetical protein